jgi:heme exporter protein A
MKVIEVSHLVKRFGSRMVLKGVDFEVQPGEFVALLGPNGAGKTTFIRILSSLLQPSLGEVNLCGCRLPAQADQVRRKIGVVAHQPLVYGDLTAEENLRFYARLYAVADREARIRVVLEQIGLDGRRKDLARTYSRGMQQRLAIGRAILHDPEVLLLDEPHTGLDQEAGEMLDAVLRQVSAQNRAVVMATHDLARAAGLASRYDVLSHGIIQASAPAGAIPADGLLAFYRRAVEQA